MAGAPSGAVPATAISPSRGAPSDGVSATADRCPDRELTATVDRPNGESRWAWA